MKRAALALLLLGAHHLALRWHGRALPLITDEGEYAVAARAWAEGGLPYRDAYSQKPPVTFLLYRLPLSPRSTATLFSLATMLVLFLAVPSTAPLAVRLAAPAAFASMSTLPLGDFGFPANTEGFLNLFTSLSVLFLLQRRAAWSGLFVGLALMTKQTSLYSAVAVVGLTYSLHGRRALLNAVLGASFFPLFFVVYFSARGALPQFLECVYTGNARYAAVLLMTGALSGQLRWFFSTLLPSLLLFMAPALALALHGLRGEKAGKDKPAPTAAVLWLGTAVAGALTGLFLFPHYFVAAVPALALCSAFGVAKLQARWRPGAVALLALWPVLMAPRLYFAEAPRDLAARLLHPNPLFEVKELGEAIAADAAMDEELFPSRLYVFGSEGALHVYSGRVPATRYTLSYGLTLFPPSQTELAAERARLSGARRPKYFVWSCQPLSTLISNQASQEFADWLRTDYLPRDYRYLGSIDVGGHFKLAPVSEKPDFTPGDRLLLFKLIDPDAPNAAQQRWRP